MKKSRPLAAKPAAAGPPYSFMRDSDGRLGVEATVPIRQEVHNAGD